MSIDVLCDNLWEWTDAYSRTRDPDTSHEAAESIKATDMEATVLTALKECGERGATTHELGDKLGLGRDSVSPRMPPLIRKGYAEQTEERRKGPSGRNCIVFKAK